MARQQEPYPGGINRETPHLPSPGALAHEAKGLAERLGLTIPPLAVRLLIKGYLSEGYRHHSDFTSYVLSYADPTGNAAVRNVTREARR